MEHALGAVITDDQNFLEFAIARGLGRRRFVDADLIDLSRRLRASTPETVGTIDWARVRDERWLSQQALGGLLSSPADKEPIIRPMIAAFEEGRYDAALKTWKELQRSGERATTIR